MTPSPAPAGPLVPVSQPATPGNNAHIYGYVLSREYPGRVAGWGCSFTLLGRRLLFGLGVQPWE